MQTLSLRLFGGFDLRDGGGAPIPVPSKKSRCLLAYLVLAQGQPVRRDLLAGLFWGDRSDTRARHSLSDELYRLRRCFSKEISAGFTLSNESIAVSPSVFDVDVIRFERAVAAQGHTEIAAGTALYTGELLPGFEIDQEGFDGWLAGERERLRNRAIVALRDTISAQTVGAPADAVESAQRLLSIEPTDEEAHRALMLLHADAGRRDLALRQYKKCAEVLWDELGIEPDAKTRAIHDRLIGVPQSGDIAVPPGAATASAERPERRLTVIASMDVAGYSRLMGVDEAGTRANLNDHRKTVIDPSIERHSGRIVNTAGDGLLVEFESVVDALHGAFDVQRRMAERNATIPEQERITFRMGINLGDVIVEGGDLHGDGVNVAARLQAIADAGGICISGVVFEQARNKVPFVFSDLGEQALKNIAEPVRVYRMVLAPAAAQQRANTGNGEAVRPSIAVLPFRNMSASAENAFIAEGLVEDLTTMLARVPGFCVISGISSASYQDQSAGARQIGHDLKVRYLVRGSLRPVREGLRLTVELVDTASAQQIWAERFDRSPDWLASLQDELVTSIVSRIEPALAGAEVSRMSARRTKDLDAWALYHKSLDLAQHGWRDDVVLETIDALREAVARDPEFALGYGRLSLVLAVGHLLGIVDAADDALAAAERAIELGSNSSEALSNAGCALLDIGQRERAADLLQRAVELNPSNGQAWVLLGCCRNAEGRYDEAIESLSYGLRISPRDPRFAVWTGVYARALERAGRLEDALAQAREACKLDGRHHGPRVVLALLMLRAGRVGEARAALSDARRLRPALTMREAAGLIGKEAALNLRAIW